MDVPPDILLIDKPKSITSFDVIRRLRHKLGIRKMGHAGTLDPLATGLMIVGIGQGTKRLAEYLKLPKEYIAEILVGERRTTGDIEGEVIEATHVPLLNHNDVAVVLNTLRGVHTLPVSAYSAIKKDGVPMYKRARRAEKLGETVTDLPLRDMEVTDVELIGMHHLGDQALITVRFAVGSGTYIRSLAEELGKRLGYPATLFNLRRTIIGEFSIEDSQSL